ncbi:MAG TPA: TadE/TadG family type IV pilus assembly protein [Candidatus Limnocylindria bacterium]
MKRFMPFIRGDLGQSIVEMALAMPLLAFLLIGGADVARAFAIQIAVQNGARAGAEASAIDFTPSGAEAVAWTKQEMGRTPGMDSSICQVPPSATNCTITVTRKQSDGTTDCLQTPSLATPCFFTVRVQYRFRTIIPWPLLPNQFDFDRKTIVRTFI